MEEKLILIYDDSFEGILTCLYYQAKHNNVYTISHKPMQKNIFVKHVYLKTNFKLASKMHNFLERTCSKNFIEDLYYCNLSSSDNKGSAILQYFKLAKDFGKNVNKLFSHQEAYPLRRLVRQVNLERHRFYGLLRFSEYDTFMLARYAPDNNITELIMPYFADRLSCNKFVVLDEKRSFAGIYDTKNWFIREGVNSKLFRNDDSDIFKKLWQEYYSSVSIKERTNLSLRSQHMPKRYWKYLTEINKEND
jgi:probable DNA metabolism protein